MVLAQTEQQGTPYRRLTVLAACVVLAALTLTWTFLGMRSVMDVGGACAEGGPYEIAQPCPGGTWMLAVAVPALIITAMLGSAIAVSLSGPDLLLPMWAFLFGSLGWNFLEYGVFSGDLVWGWIICGVVFELMALPAFVILLPSREGSWSWVPPTASTPARTTLGRWWAAYTVLAAVGVVLAVLSHRAWS